MSKEVNKKNNMKKIRIREKNKEIPQTAIISEKEERRIRKITKIIVFLTILFLVIYFIDYIRFKMNKTPIFAIEVINQDIDLKEYYGLGYKVMKLNRSDITENIKFGSWFMNKNDFEISNEYSKTREVNVEKLKILEDLTQITNNEKMIPENPDEYIKENQDKYNQIKEMELGYKYFIELIIHDESATEFEKYLLARMINDKNEKIDFKFKTVRDFIEQYEIYLSQINIEELDDSDLDKIAYYIIFGNPEIN